MNDNQFLLSVLNDGRPHSLNEILLRSLRERGCGLTVHSRAADLRKTLREEGYDIRNIKTGRRGNGSLYQLVALRPEQEAGLEPSPALVGALEPQQGAPNASSPPDGSGVVTAAAPESLTALSAAGQLSAQSPGNTEQAGEVHGRPDSPESQRPPAAESAALTLFGDERSHYAREGEAA